MKKKIVLADDKSSLIKSLMVKLLSEQSDKYDVELLTNKDYIQWYFSQTYSMDLLVIGEKLFGLAADRETIPPTVILCDEKMDPPMEGTSVLRRDSDFNKLFFEIVNSAESQTIQPSVKPSKKASVKPSKTAEMSREEDKGGESYSLAVLDEAGRMDTMILQDGLEGLFRFSKEVVFDEAFYVSAGPGTLTLVCGSGVTVSPRDAAESGRVDLHKNALLQISSGRSRYTLYAERQKKEDAIYHNYRIDSGCTVSIGKESFNTLFYDNPYMSKQHAELSYREGEFFLRDLGSTNGTYVNGRRISSCRLSLGDRVYMMGLQLIAGCGYLAINDFHRGVFLNSSVFTLVQSPSELEDKLEPVNTSPILEEYDRKPRKRRPVSGEDIEIEAPPMSMHNANMPLLLRIGGSAVSGTVSALSGHYTMLITSLLFPFLSNRFTEKQREEYEKKRTQYYSAYLDQKEELIRKEIMFEQEALNTNYPGMQKLLEQVRAGSRLWERRVADDDFLSLRIGNGAIPIKVKLKYPRERLNLEDDPLEKRMLEMSEREYNLQKAPIQVSLMEDYVLGIEGDRKERINFMRVLIMELVLLHSYEEVKTIFLLTEDQLKQMEFIRFLPHTWNKQGNMRYLATNISESVRIGESLRDELSDELKHNTSLKNVLKKRPYYVVFAFDQKLYESLEILKDILMEDHNVGLSIVSACDSLPKDCTKVIRVSAAQSNELIHIKEIDNTDLSFAKDIFDKKLAAEAMRRIANVSVKKEEGAFVLPKMMTFLEMFGVGRIEHLNPLRRWESSSPDKSLAAPVGVGTDGETFLLDLHEKAQGPHGLVAGMTGSGKSEFIITYILSMAVSYHPDEIAFVLIDYKGGGLAGAFDDPARGIHLPHLVGTITNLDGAGIRRSLITLQSELLRRQRVFNEAKTIANEGTMNIYDYQKLYRKGVVHEPMPHLFIISDEFAELKAQKPEFMDQLISIARIGRSLGVHLILATQKPSGVVNEQILSNTKFRVCLKVQDRADSQDMLQRPDAAELKETGRFYLQVGYNEYFAMGQSSWSGAPYEPQDTVVTKKDQSLQAIDLTGETIAMVEPVPEKSSSGISQLVAVVKYLSDLAASTGIRSENLWMPPLEPVIPYEQIRDEYEEKELYRIPLGRIDDPENQKQYLWQPDLLKTRNIWIVGMLESGKSTLLETMLLSLSDHLSPEDLQYYILTYSGKTLQALKNLPHCGAVLGEENMDSLERFFRMIDEIIEERKEIYREYEVSSFESCRQALRLPMILVVIDNVRQLKDTKEAMNYYDALPDYLKNGLIYGVQFVITSSALGDLMSRAKSEIGDRIALRVKDRFDIGELLGTKVKDVPPENPGRGTILYEDRPLECQAAIYRADLQGKERMDALRKTVGEIVLKYTGCQAAKELEEIHEDEDYADFLNRFKKKRLPIGYSLITARPVVLPEKQFSMLAVYFGNQDSTAPIIKNMMHWAGEEGMKVMILRRKEKSLFEKIEEWEDGNLQSCSVTWLTMSEEDIHSSWTILSEEILQRKELLIEYCGQHGLDYKQENIAQETFAYMSEHTQPYLIFCERFYDYCMSLADDAKQVLPTILSLLRQYNMYMIGCFYPGDADRLSVNAVMRSFNPEENILMYGGNLDEQGLTSLPSSYSRNKESFAYNKCLMKYRGMLHPVLTPCGADDVLVLEEDDRPVF